MPEEIVAQGAEDDVELSSTEDGEAGGQDAEDGQKFDAAYVRKLRDEAAKYRTQLRAIEKVEEDRKKAAMSEADRLRAELAEAQAAQEQALALANERLMRSAVLAAAAEAGFSDPSDAWRMLEATGLAIGDDGEVTGATEAIQGLAKAKPYLLKQVQPTNEINAGRGRGSGQKTEDPKAVEARLRQRFRI